MSEGLPVIIVLFEYLQLHLILTHPSLALLMQVLLQKHYESQAVYHKELFLLLTQLAFLFLLLLAHDLCTLIDLLDAFFDF